MTRPTAIETWVSADRCQDLHVMATCLAADVRLVSPLTDGFDFRGVDAAMAVFSTAFDLLRDIEIARVTGAGDDWVLHGRNTLRGRNLEEIQWLHLDEHGLIDEITLFIRPVAAAVDLLSRIGPGLARRDALHQRAGLASRAAAPLALALRATETFVMPRLGRR